MLPCFPPHLVRQLNSQPLLVVVEALCIQLRPVHPQEEAGRRVEDWFPCRPRQEYEEDADDTPVKKRTLHE
jgi:hypothetical protein